MKPELQEKVIIMKRGTTITITAAFFLLLIVSSYLPLCISTTDSNIECSMPVNKSNKKLPLSYGFFTENMGQWNSEILFLADTSFGHVGFGRGAVYYDLIRFEGQADTMRSIANDRVMLDGVKRENEDLPEFERNIVKLSFDGSNNVHPIATEPLEYKSNFFVGNDPADWVTGVKNYRKVVYEDLWEGIDIVYYIDPNGLKYDFILHPGADPDLIQIAVEGHSALTLENNALMIDTPLGVPLMDGGLDIFYADAPREQIGGRYKLLDDKTYTFILGPYDTTRQLVIDPLIYSTFIGGYKQESGMCVAVDADGNAFIGGTTKSMDFPTTPGAYKETTDYSSYDIFVLKLNQEGSDLVYSTYILGSESEECWDLAIDPNGNAYITGGTDSPNFPTTPDAYDRSNNGDNDIFVSKLSPSGSELVYSTLIGGYNNDWGDGISIDDSGNVYLTGGTNSVDFPTTPGCFQDAYGGGSYDGWVLKFNSYHTLNYSTFVGGNDYDYGFDIAIDGSGNAYVTGETDSRDFPNTTGAYRPDFVGVYTNIFVVKLNASGTGLNYSTFIGEGRTWEMALDTQGNVYAAGESVSKDFPTTPGAYDRTYADWETGYEEGILFKLNSAGSDLVYSTFIGGSSYDVCRSLALDGSGNVYMAGYTWSEDFPITTGAYDNTSNYDFDGFVMKINPSGVEVLYSTYFGGSRSDSIYDIALDLNRNAYLVGTTASYDFPTTAGAYNNTHYNNYDVFVFKLNFSDQPSPPSAPLWPYIVVEDSQVNLTWNPPLANGGSKILGYNIYRGNQSNQKKLHAELGNVLIYNDTQVTNGIRYYYQITAYSAVGESIFSTEINTTACSFPSPPRNLRVRNGTGYVNLTWEAPLDDGGLEIYTYYIRQRKIPGTTINIFVRSGGTFYNNSNVQNGVKCRYWVTAWNALGESGPSNEVIGNPAYKPKPPKNLENATGYGYVNLTWQSPDSNGGSEITEYRIFKYDDPTDYRNHSNYTFIGSVNGTTWHYNDSNVTNGEMYHYHVRSVNDIGTSGPSEIHNVTPLGLPLPPKYMLWHSGDWFVNFTWFAPDDDGGTNITGYSIYRSNVTNSTGNRSSNTTMEHISVLDSVNATTFSYNDTSVINGNSYTYFLTSRNRIGESVFSEAFRAFPMGPPDPPGVVNVSAGDGVVNISWSVPAYTGGTDITGYKIFRGNESEMTLLVQVDSDIHIYLDTAVANGRSYNYYIISVNSEGESQPAYGISVMPRGPPDPPWNVTASGHDSFVQLSWNAPENDGGAKIIKYKIYRSTGTGLGNETFLGFTVAPELSYGDHSVTNGQEYYYYITAENILGESEPSKIVNATPEKEQTTNGGSDEKSTPDNSMVVAGWLVALIIVVILVGYCLLRFRWKMIGPEAREERESREKLEYKLIYQPEQIKKADKPQTEGTQDFQPIKIKKITEEFNKENNSPSSDIGKKEKL